jgi:L-alanine-DL-glutamate epimerase-like enolase superfamily enzyme
MQITKVSLYRKDLPMICGKFTCSLEEGVSSAEVVIVKIETDEGITGYGESGSIGSFPNYGHAILASTAELIRHHIIGKDPRNINRINASLGFMVGHGYAKVACDIACWDILGKSLNQPISALLGGALQQSVPLYRSITEQSPEMLLEAISTWRAEGYRYFQLRVGLGTPAEDIERITTVLSHRKEGEHYTIDPAGRWRVDQALQILNALSEFDVMIEQPCNTLAKCVSLRQHTQLPIKLDNIITDTSQLIKAYTEQACDAVSLKLTSFGGITPTIQARELTRAMAIPVTYDSTWGTEITAAAMTHLALTTTPNRLLNTCDLHSYTSFSITRDNNLQSEQGQMFFLEEKAGLGIEIDNDVLGEADITITL